MLDQSQIDEIVLTVKDNSFAVIENFVSQDAINELLAMTASQVVSVNCNQLKSVTHGNTQFFTNVISNSKTIHDLILSPFVLNICSAYLGDNCRLVNNRIQTTRANIAMPWHTDNNIIIDGKLVGRHDMAGLQFVLYLTNVSDAPFQLIKDSHKWSLSCKQHYILDSDIGRANYEIIELNPPPGTLLILNTHTFHRAKPIRDSNYLRSILLFQVDSITSSYPDHGEKLYVNTEYFSEYSPQILSFLGFGRKRAYPPFPETSVKTLNSAQITLLWASLFKVLPKIFLLKALKRLLPPNLLSRLKIFAIAVNANVYAQDADPVANPYLER